MFHKFREKSLPIDELPDGPPAAAGPGEFVALLAQEGEATLISPEQEALRQRRKRLADIRQIAHERLLELLNLSALSQVGEDAIRSEISNVLKELLPAQSTVLSRSERDTLTDDLYHEVMGFGPLDLLLKDETVSDILINGPDHVFVEQNGVLELTDIQFQSEAHLRRILQKIVGMIGRRLDESTPYVDARLPDGSRLNAVISPVALDGTLVSIRKFRREKLSLEQLVSFGSLSPKMAVYLQAAVASRLNIIISGGTGSGKTTLLNAFSAYIGKRERIITIEDVAELQLQQTHVGRMEARPANIEGRGAVTQRDCIRNALRMRPDRIIVGETRGDEVIDMLQAMNTGHDGSMTTIHSNSARDACSRLENLFAMTGIDIPLGALRRQIASALNVVVQVNRLQDGSRRVTSITEVTGCESDVISMQELFYFEHTGVSLDNRVEGRFVAAGVRSNFAERFKRWGLKLPADLYETSEP